MFKESLTRMLDVRGQINCANKNELDDNLMLVEGSNLGFPEEAALPADEDSGIITMDDDIIVLDDSGIGVTPSKKARNEGHNAMDVDESAAVTKQAKESLGTIIRNMTRKELENLVLSKTVEAIASHTEAGQLRSKVIELQIQKNKIANKMSVVMKQFAQLSTAVENGLDPKGGIGQPVRFTRSVGLQITIESTVKTGQSRNLVRFAEPTRNGIEANAEFKVPQQPNVVKRTHPNAGQAKTVEKPIANQATDIAAKKVQFAAPLPTPTEQNVEPGIVDLTDDDPPPPKPAPAPVHVSTTNNDVRSLNKNPKQKAQSKQVAPKMALPKQIKSVPFQQKLDHSQPLVFKLTTISGGNENGVLKWRPYTPKQFILPPLPAAPPHKTRNDKLKTPPKPQLTLLEDSVGIVLSWKHPTPAGTAEVTTYQIFACQENLANSNKTCEWKRVGDVKALPLPMACTVSQFKEANRYYFIIRGIDVYGRAGPFCEPQSIQLTVKK